VISHDILKKCLVLFLCSLNLKAIQKFDVYYLPDPSGPFKVGYKEIPQEGKSY
jgi:hypothetical protein